jgi:hypothetical protein
MTSGIVSLFYQRKVRIENRHGIQCTFLFFHTLCRKTSPVSSSAYTTSGWEQNGIAPEFSGKMERSDDATMMQL